MTGKTLTILILVVIAAILSLQNTHTVEVNILFWTASYSLIILIYIVLAAGFIAGFFTNKSLKTGKKDKQSDDH